MNHDRQLCKSLNLLLAAVAPRINEPSTFRTVACTSEIALQFVVEIVPVNFLDGMRLRTSDSER
jgi:hypothetical protein